MWSTRKQVEELLEEQEKWYMELRQELEQLYGWLQTEMFKEVIKKFRSQERILSDLWGYQEKYINKVDQYTVLKEQQTRSTEYNSDGLLEKIDKMDQKLEQILAKQKEDTKRIENLEYFFTIQERQNQRIQKQLEQQSQEIKQLSTIIWDTNNNIKREESSIESAKSSDMEQVLKEVQELKNIVVHWQEAPRVLQKIQEIESIENEKIALQEKKAISIDTEKQKIIQPESQEIVPVFTDNLKGISEKLKEIVSYSWQLEINLKKSTAENIQIHQKLVEQFRNKLNKLVSDQEEKQWNSEKTAETLKKILKNSVLKCLRTKEVKPFIEEFLFSFGIRKVIMKKGHKLQDKDYDYCSGDHDIYEKVTMQALDGCILDIYQDAYVIDYLYEDEMIEAVMEGEYKIGRYI